MASESVGNLVDAIINFFTSGVNEASVLEIPFWAKLLILIGGWTLVGALIKGAGYGLLGFAYVIGSFKVVKEAIYRKEEKKSEKIAEKVKKRIS